MKLLSKKYKSSSQKLEYKCLVCGYIGTKRLNSLLKGHECPSCAGMLRRTYDEVKLIFKEKNMKLLSKKYKNNSQKLEYKCLICGYVGTKRLNNLLKGKKCPSCAGLITYTYQKTKQFFKEKNMKLLSKEYKNTQQKLKYKCLICGYTGLKSLGHLAHSCNWYNRNLTEEDRINRRITTEDKKWAKEIKKIYDYTCQKCGKRGGIINSHHKNAKKSFPEQRHLISNGIVFCEDCHKKFHKKYGKGNNTEIQTELFLNEKGIKYA